MRETMGQTKRSTNYRNKLTPRKVMK